VCEYLRVHGYLPGGKDHFAADRAVADEVFARMPAARTVARENRKFLGRTVRFLVREAGVRAGGVPAGQRR
jgi:hypothetical protein